MDRIFQKKLEQWKTSGNRKPLIVRGARQVGKSYSITQFGKTGFQGKIHVVDLEKHPEWHGIFTRNLDPSRILSELEIILNAKISPGRDLLFFDEIQAAPRAIMSLRYFYESLPELHVISAGSLLMFAMKDICFPLGSVNLMSMAPMNFYEFLLATGKEMTAELICSKPEKLPETIHSEILESLRQYLFIGGMPECVEVWRNSGSMADVFDIQTDLVAAYRQDFSKYAPFADKRSLNNALSAVAKNVGNQIKYTQLSDEFTGPTNKKAFDLLQLARVIHKVSATSPASLPFDASASEKKFKALLVDIGLMHSLNDFRSGREYGKSDLLSIFNGALAEQFVGQEFISCGKENPYYWSREAKSSVAEVDYLIVRNNKIFPVEVKSGASGKLRSLHLLLQHYPNIEQGFVLSTAPYGKLPDQKLTFLPLYYAFMLMEQDYDQNL
ncbi:MAG: AAA family ATPase [Bacteroidota bacterium]